MVVVVVVVGGEVGSTYNYDGCTIGREIGMVRKRLVILTIGTRESVCSVLTT